MFYRCQRFNSKPIQRLKRVQKERSKGNRSAPWSGAPDCPVCHRIVSGAPGRIDLKLFSFGFPKRSSSIIHRTVRCATGLSGVPQDCPVCQRSNGYLRATVDSDSECGRSQSSWSGDTGLSGAAPDCPVPHKDKASNGRPAPSPNGRMTWRHTGHCSVAHRTLSGGAPDTVWWRTGLSGAPFASTLHQWLVFGWWL